MKKSYSHSHLIRTIGIKCKKLLSFLTLSPLIVLLFSCENGFDFNNQQKQNQASLDKSRTENRQTGVLGVNILLNTSVNNAILDQLKAYGTIANVIPQINAVVIRTTSDKLSAIQKLSFVAAANPDAVRTGSPIDTVPIADFENGLNSWNLDAVNVTDLNAGRTVAQDATGVYIGILDTGFLDSWRQYFPQERIAVQYAKAFSGGGADMGRVSEPPNLWEHDQNSHGTHVTSTILGFKLGNAYFNGVAPQATVIPVKVLNQAGWGWSSVIARGIVYMAELKDGPLQNSPVIVNMSLGGPTLDAVEKAAIDYAISKGVIIVAAAGNSGNAGMGYPGAYEPVISVGSAGWKDGWTTPTWWFTSDFPDPTDQNDLYISTFSGREKTNQDLDVIAPGSHVVGPYQLNSGQISYFFLSGTSMACPHVAGIVALMAQHSPSLTAAEAETILEAAAIPIAAGTRSVRLPGGVMVNISWGDDATGSGFITADGALGALGAL